MNVQTQSATSEEKHFHTRTPERRDRLPALCDTRFTEFEIPIGNTFANADRLDPFRGLPISAVPTALCDRVPMDIVARMFGLDLRDVRAISVFTRDVLVSRAVEAGLVSKNWRSGATSLRGSLEDLSKAMLAHWSHLLSQYEFEERKHVLAVIAIHRRTTFLGNF